MTYIQEQLAIVDHQIEILQEKRAQLLREPIVFHAFTYEPPK